MAIPHSISTEAAFENPIAVCPGCGYRNIFNRAIDLPTFVPIDFRQVRCQRCGCPFNINGDTINAVYEMLLFDCPEFFERKRYIQCVLNVVQAYEVFFNHFLYVQLLYRPFGKDVSRDIKLLNELGRVLYQRVRGFSYRGMRDLVVRLIVDKVAPDSLQAAEVAIAAIPLRQHDTTTIPSEKTAGVNDERLRRLLLRLVKAEAHCLRNRSCTRTPTGPPWRWPNVYIRKPRDSFRDRRAAGTGLRRGIGSERSMIARGIETPTPEHGDSQ